MPSVNNVNSRKTYLLHTHSVVVKFIRPIYWPDAWPDQFWTDSFLWTLFGSNFSSTKAKKLIRNCLTSERVESKIISYSVHNIIVLDVVGVKTYPLMFKVLFHTNFKNNLIFSLKKATCSIDTAGNMTSPPIFKMSFFTQY